MDNRDLISIVDAILDEQYEPSPYDDLVDAIYSAGYSLIRREWMDEARGPYQVLAWIVQLAEEALKHRRRTDEQFHKTNEDLGMLIKAFASRFLTADPDESNPDPFFGGLPNDQGGTDVSDTSI